MIGGPEAAKQYLISQGMWDHYRDLPVGALGDGNTIQPLDDVEADLAACDRAIERMGWPEINAFMAEPAQSPYEDAGGYLLRKIKTLFGIKPDRLETYREAAKRLVAEARAQDGGSNKALAAQPRDDVPSNATLRVAKTMGAEWKHDPKVKRSQEDEQPELDAIIHGSMDKDFERKAVLEEAAKVADRESVLASTGRSCTARSRRETADHIAQAIRALAEGAGK